MTYRAAKAGYENNDAMTGIIDYEAGNIRSVENALKRLGAEYILSGDPAVLSGCDRLLLPGVGEAGWAM